MSNKIENLAWVLPRPPKSCYIGGFPLHFEKKLLELLKIDPDNHLILQPFGGMAEYGYRLDINSGVQPHIVGDSHTLPIRDNYFDLVILDPPYNEVYSKRLYKSDHVPLHFRKYTDEACRVTKEYGYIVMYHYIATPAIRKTVLYKRIFLENRQWHKLRCIHIHQKRSDLWVKK